MDTEYKKFIEQIKNLSGEELEKAVKKESERIRLGEALQGSSFEGNLKEWTSLIEQGADVDFDNYGPMYMAVFGKNLNFVKFLVEKGACVKDGYFSPIRTAFEKGYLKIVKYFVEIGCDPVDCVEYTTETIRENHPSVVSYISQKIAEQKNED